MSYEAPASEVGYEVNFLRSDKGYAVHILTKMLKTSYDSRIIELIEKMSYEAHASEVGYEGFTFHGRTWVTQSISRQRC